MGYRGRNDDTKIFAAIACLCVGFLFVWSIAARTADIYELRLDAESCNQVRTLGLMPPDNCVITVPFRPVGMGPPVGYLTLPDGNDVLISPIAAKLTNRSMEWSSSMKTSFLMALMFWAASLALLFSAFRDRE